MWQLVASHSKLMDESADLRQRIRELEGASQDSKMELDAAAAKIVSHLWRRQMGAGGGGRGNERDQSVSFGWRRVRGACPGVWHARSTSTKYGVLKGRPCDGVVAMVQVPEASCLA